MSVIPRKMASAQGAPIVNHRTVVKILRAVNLLRVVFLVRRGPLGKRNENRNEGTFACSLGTKTGTRAQSPKPPFCETALFLERELGSVVVGSAFLGRPDLQSRAPGPLILKGFGQI